MKNQSTQLLAEPYFFSKRGPSVRFQGWHLFPSLKEEASAESVNNLYIQNLPLNTLKTEFFLQNTKEGGLLKQTGFFSLG